jgi:hypothetical protein
MAQLSGWGRLGVVTSVLWVCGWAIGLLVGVKPYLDRAAAQSPDGLVKSRSLWAWLLFYFAIAAVGPLCLEFPRKSRHRVKGYPACSYSAGET